MMNDPSKSVQLKSIVDWNEETFAPIRKRLVRLFLLGIPNTPPGAPPGSPTHDVLTVYCPYCCKLDRHVIGLISANHRVGLMVICARCGAVSLIGPQANWIAIGRDS